MRDTSDIKTISDFCFAFYVHTLDTTFVPFSLTCSSLIGCGCGCPTRDWLSAPNCDLRFCNI